MELFLSLETTPSPPPVSADVASPPTASMDHFHLHVDEELEKLSRESIELVNKPFIGMEFDTINASEEFWKRYGYEIGFGVRILNSNFGKDKIVTSRTYVCSKQGQKAKDKRRVNSKPRADKRCNCGVIMRVRLSRETGKYYVKEFVEKHNHDLEGKKPIHNRRGITTYTTEFERWDINAKSNEKVEVNHSHGLSNVQKIDILDAEFKRIIDRVVGYDDEVFEGVRRIINSAHAFMDEHIISKEKSEENISPASFEPVNIQNGDARTGIKDKNYQKLSVDRSMVLESTLPVSHQPLPVTSDFPEGNLRPSTSSEIQLYTPPPTDSADMASPPTASMDDFHPHTDEEREEQSGESGELVYKPFIGMEFDTINASELFWKKYGYETGFAVRIQNSNLGKDKIVTSRTYVCSKQGQKTEDKRRVISKPRADKRCNCGVLMRVSLSRETGKYHVKEFVEKHNHDLEWKETIHNRRAITTSERWSRNANSNPKVVVNHSPGLSNVQKTYILDLECRQVIHRVVAYIDEVFEGVCCIINTAHSFIDEHIMSKENSGENTLPPSFELVNIQNVFMETTPAIPISMVTAAEPPPASASSATPPAAYVDTFLPHTEEIEEQPEESLELVFQPFIGMEFDTINASEMFWKRYGYETGFGVRIQNSNFGKDKLVTSRTYVCSKQGQKAEDKRRVNSKPREDKRCNCGVFMRISLSKETGKYYVKEFVEKHNHDLEGKEAIHSLRAITKYITKGWTKTANIDHKVVANRSPDLSDIQKVDILDAECRQVAHRVLGYDDEVFEGVRRIINSAHSFIDEHIRSKEKSEKNISQASFDPVSIQNGVVVIGPKKNLNQKLSGKCRRVSLAEEELSAKKLRTVQQSNLRL